MGCLSFHRSIRIWSIIFRSSITGLNAISRCLRIFGFSRVHPMYSCLPLIATWGHLSLRLASPFICHLYLHLVYRLALLGLTIPLPRLDCPASRLWSHSDAGCPAGGGARFVFLPAACPRPRLPCMLLECPPWPLDWFGIWSMKEFCNLNYWSWDVFEEFFHWLDASNENYGLIHSRQMWIMSLSASGHLFVKMSISMGRNHWNRTVMVSILFNVLYLRYRCTCRFMFLRVC